MLEKTIEQKKTETVDDVLESLVGILPDTGKTLEQYREERISDKYENADCKSWHNTKG
jgi:CRISPR/Cas system-associated endonuclease Cas3-HD